MQEQSRVHVSYILPVFNEESGLEAMVGEADRRLTVPGNTHEIVIVDDGSTDRTAELAENLSKRRPDKVRVVHLSRNAGYAAAVSAGIASARGAIVAYAR